MSSVSELTRMSGLMSGLDTEALVKAASANTKNSINARKQKLQTLQWKQEAYRDVISKISDFQKKYLDIISENSIRANSVMKANKAESSDESLKVTASTSATAGKYTITSARAATAAKVEGLKAASGSVALNFQKASSGSNTVKVTLDGVSKDIVFSGSSSTAETRENFLNAVNEAFEGASGAKFAFKQGTNDLTVVNGEGDKVSHIFSVNYAECVGLKNDASNQISKNSKLSSINFEQGLEGSNFEFSINGKDFSFTSDATIKDVLDKVNKSDAGVKMSFSQLTQSFTLETNETGAGQQIKLSQTKGNLLNSMFNLDVDELGTEPTFAKGLTSNTVDPSVKFEFSVSKNGLEAGDGITVNGKTLSVVGLSKTQSTEKITIDGNETTASLYEMNGEKIYKYNKDGVTHYAKKNGSDFEDVMTVENSVVNVGGVDQEGVTEAEQLSTLGIEKKYNEYSGGDIANALNSAYKASFPDSAGAFMAVADGDSFKVKFSPPAGECFTASASGNITLADTGHTVDGKVSNYDAAAYPDSHVVSSSKSLTLKVNGVAEFTVNGTGTDGAVTIKDLTDSGYFNYDANEGVLSVNGTVKLEAVGDAANDIKKLFGTTELAGEDCKGSKMIYGQNAQITVNGVTLENASNTFSIEGVSFNVEDIKAFDEEDIALGKAEEITVNVSKDTSKIKDTIKGFMEGYNALLDDLHKVLETSRPKESGDYFDPLTEEQEDEMEQEEIDKWNEKAKTGLLYHDSTITRVFNSLRSAINASVGGMTLQALGIDSSSDYTEYGKLEFMKADGAGMDGEAKLDAAIEKYGEDIAKFFTDSTNGLGAALEKAVDAAIDTSVNSNGYAKGILSSLAGVANTRTEKTNYLYNQIDGLKSIIDKLNEKYESQQERLWKQYTRLETYINNMNGQSSALFGTGNGMTG